MTLQEILLGGGGGLALLLTLIQIAPVKVNPWSALARALGKAFNGEVLSRLDGLEKTLCDHIHTDEEHNADEYRRRILRFNNELICEIPHTREEFLEALSDIDGYEGYCKAHPDYKNNRCWHAIANINRVYDDRLKLHDFKNFDKEA